MIDKYTYLGVKIDKDLTFMPHFKKIISTCNQKLFTLAKIRKYITQNIAIRLCKTLILPIIDYRDVFYCGLASTHLDKIQKLQNRALRIVDLPPGYTSNVHLHRKYQVIPLFLRRGNNLLKLIHTFLRHNLDESGVEWNFEGHHHDSDSRIMTRQALTPYIPLKMLKSAKYRLSCAYLGPKMWLELPMTLRQTSDKDDFKIKLKLRAREELAQMQSVYR